MAAFDPQDVPDPVAALGWQNYWGYSPVSLASPHPGYATQPDSGRTHRRVPRHGRGLPWAGIGVLLDVVLNHTAEGGADGPVLNFKGLMPDEFYHRDGNTFRDYTGCGNTINTNHPLVTRLLVGHLRIWAEERQVDGFRFDLASVFIRGSDGEPLEQPPAPWAIEDAFPGTPLIAEPWDAAGLYHVGNFPGRHWSEWNGRYRDALRRFLGGRARAWLARSPPAWPAAATCMWPATAAP